MTPELDSAFNLTSTYLQNSDSIRRFGEIENSIFNEDWETTVRRVMNGKQKFDEPLEKFGGVFNSLWYDINEDMMLIYFISYSEGPFFAHFFQNFSHCIFILIFKVIDIILV